MKSLIEQYIESNHFGRMIGMDFEIIEPGKVVYKLEISDNHLATPNAAHGGCLSALLDATMGVGALSLMEKDFSVVSTLEMKVSFLESVLKNDHLFSTSKIIRKGKKIIFVEADIENQNGQLVAKGSGTFILVDGFKAGYKK
jgi:acyl-CoA thioesterase